MEPRRTATASELARYRATAQKREAERRAAEKLRREKALVVATHAANLLRSEFEATEVMLFGSVAHGGALSRRSDIDVAASGIPSDRYYAAVGRLQALDPAFSVDLVRLEEAPAPLLAAIKRSGQPL